MRPKRYLAPDEKRLLARYWQSASGFWRGPNAWRAWLLLLMLVATVLLQLAVQFWLNFWNRDFFNAIERKDSLELWRQAMIFLPLAAASLTLAIASVWGRMTMQRTWRAWLSAHLYDYWLERGHSHQLHLMQGEHDNPEYRIAEDARVATDLPIDLTLGLLSAVLTAITFIGVLWSVGGGIEIKVFDYDLAIPGYLVIAVVLYIFASDSRDDPDRSLSHAHHGEQQTRRSRTEIVWRSPSRKRRGHRPSQCAARRTAEDRRGAG